MRTSRFSKRRAVLTLTLALIQLGPQNPEADLLHRDQADVERFIRTRAQGEERRATPVAATTPPLSPQARPNLELMAEQMEASEDPLAASEAPRSPSASPDGSSPPSAEVASEGKEERADEAAVMLLDRVDAAEVPAGDPGERFVRGAWVEVRGLKGRVDLNGSRGRVVGWLPEKQRYQLRLQQGSIHNFKPENLFAEASSGAGRPKPQQGPAARDDTVAKLIDQAA